MFIKGTMLESYRIPFRRKARSTHIVWGRMNHSGARYLITRPPTAERPAFWIERKTAGPPRPACFLSTVIENVPPVGGQSLGSLR
jgi:hypothetical protein